MGLNTQVLGISVDHVPCLKAWSDSLGGISYPLLSDFWPHGSVAECYGVLRAKDGKSERAIFVIDRDGFIRYIDIHDIDDQPDNEVLRGVLREIEGPSTRPAHLLDVDAQPHVEEEAGAPEGVVLYCARWCKDCKKARAWLEAHGLPFTELDIDYDLKARMRVREWGGGRLITPVIDLNGIIVVDYDEAKLEEALGGSGAAGV